MKTKEEQIEDLKTTAAIHLKVADKLQQQIEALEKPEQWEPKGGDWWVDTSGIANWEYESTPCTIKFGVERQTLEAAEKASDAMRTHNRLLAYVDEFGGDWEAGWEDHQQKKYYVYYSYHTLGWCMHHAYNSTIGGTVYMSRDCAKGLVKKLNSGEVVL